MSEFKFYCLKDKNYLKVEENRLFCSICGKDIPIENQIYKFIDNSLPEQTMWDCALYDNMRNKRNVKIFFDRLLSFFLPSLLTSHITKYILKNYPENSKLIELGCGEASTSIALKKNCLTKIKL